jgi:hypothetical protein
MSATKSTPIEPRYMLAMCPVWGDVTHAEASCPLLLKARTANKQSPPSATFDAFPTGR